MTTTAPPVTNDGPPSGFPGGYPGGYPGWPSCTTWTDSIRNEVSSSCTAVRGPPPFVSDILASLARTQTVTVGISSTTLDTSTTTGPPTPSNTATAAPAQVPPSSSSDGPALSGGTIAGIVIGVVAIILIVILGYFVLRQRRNKGPVATQELEAQKREGPPVEMQGELGLGPQEMDVKDKGVLNPPPLVFHELHGDSTPTELDAEKRKSTHYK
ncbi:hypothetical protein M501DRAFT_1057095 [Patellaria atrata CBS 101060]|uniref:Mid2 domain-containing protein n=1 Tax=Patellaria atrata CBS 101060 TaxID=1346257 RepID=A0A9P4SBX4_9PEZI|nr:hypothetical protein M501DRAFT_1057095 [Patellaria atrata CBS 101060]